jgi:hypothetical protein
VLARKSRPRWPTRSTGELGRLSAGCQGVKDQVTELTGVEPPVDGLIDQATQAAGDIGETAQNVADSAATAVTDTTDKLTGQ